LKKFPEFAAIKKIMKLTTLLQNLTAYKIYGDKNVEIASITDDSRRVKKNSLFIAIKGLSVDGHDFIPDAIEKGTSVVVGEINPKKDWLKSTVYIKVKDTRVAMAMLASAWWGNPEKYLKIIGVTGTDGKTTTATLIWWILKESGKKVGLVSSVSAKIGKYEADTGFHVTNPEPLALYKLLSKMVKSDIDYAVLEVTSHGLDQKRVYGIPFELGVLTNISREHLDYHKNLSSYIKTKSLLFQNVNTAVLNKSDSSFVKIRKFIPTSTKIIIYPVSNLDPLLKRVINERFPENYNRLNAQAACLVAEEYKIGISDQIKAISTFPQIPGRLEEIANDKNLKIYVDFAHTPNAIKSVLTELKKQTKGKLISVFGCAGERDHLKRPLMGKISGKLADFTIITAEDPRSENVNDIIYQITKGIKSAGAKEIEAKYFDDSNHRTGKQHIFFRIPERGEAISFAVQKIAQKGDAVVICGKGHEKSMAYNGIEYPWTDQEAVRVALKGGVKKIVRPDL
jgi:UDP-N-acetylmuramoyl-L-alanyl-D-glutamate--2,6-diaminopimelate ligase